MFKIFRYWIPVIFSLSLIFFLSSIPGDHMPKVLLLDFDNSDKLEHFGIYCLLGFCFARAFSAKLQGPANWQNFGKYILLTTFLGALYGASDEFHQSFVPGRSVDIFDFVADSLGALSGSCLAFFYRRRVIPN